MPTFTTRCPQCEAGYSVDTASVGRSARCRRCGKSFTIQSPKAEATAGSTNDEEHVPATWQPGDVILNLYEVLDILGEGGMGTVYKVRHRTWNMLLAVKSPKPDALTKAGFATAFQREAETWVKLDLHPNVVCCFYVRVLGKIPRAFAEYVPGGSLSDWIRNGRLYENGPRESLKRILDIAIQFAWGLHQAHENGLVHQDVKPLNVMMTPEGSPKVTDFGLSRARPAVPAGNAVGSTFVSSRGGTPVYWSPEQSQGEPVSRTTDVWSWAVSILEMFMGEVNWPSGTIAQEYLEDCLRDGPSDPRIPWMPEMVAEILRLCFLRDPRARPSSMHKISESLRSAYHHIVGVAYPHTAPKAAEALSDSLNNRGISLIDLGKHDEAVAALAAALDSDPHHPEATYNQSLIQWRQGQIDDQAVLNRLEECARSSLDQATYNYLVGLVHLERGDWREAERRLADALRSVPGQYQVESALVTARSVGVDDDRLFDSHSGWVVAVAMSADGKRALSGAGDGSLMFWDVSNCQLLKALGGHTQSVNSVALSHDIRRGLSSGGDGVIRWWDLDSGLCLRSIETLQTSVTSVSISTDARFALSGGEDGTLKLWQLDTGRCVRTFCGHMDQARGCLSNDGRYVLSGSFDKTLKYWDAATGECLWTIVGHTAGIFSVCLSSDGRFALSASMDNTLKFWSADPVEPWRCLQTLRGHKKWVHAVSMSADMRYAVSGSWDETVKLWELSTGRCLRTLELGTKAVGAVALDASGERALLGCFDGRVKLWKTGWARTHQTCPLVLSRVVASSASHENQRLYEQAIELAQNADTQDDLVKVARLLRDARSVPGFNRHPKGVTAWAKLYKRLARETLNGGWEVATFQGHSDYVTCVALSSDSRYILSGSDDATARLWDVGKGQWIRTFVGHDGHVRSVALSQDAKLALTGSFDQTVRLWDVTSGECLRTFLGHDDGVHAVDLSGDARLGLSASRDGTLVVWETSTGRLLRKLDGHGVKVLTARFNGDGQRILSADENGVLVIWDVPTKKIHTKFRGHDSGVWSVDLTRDGRHALSASEDKTLKFWDLTTKDCLGTFEGHMNGVSAARLTFDGRFALSASGDGSLKVWDIRTHKCLRTFESHAHWVLAVDLSRDGRLALTGGADKAIKTWFLDWSLRDNHASEWHEDARPYLKEFLRRKTAHKAQAPVGRKLTEAEIIASLTRQGTPTWDEKDFEQLIDDLRCAGFGWLRPSGVRTQLERETALFDR